MFTCNAAISLRRKTDVGNVIDRGSALSSYGPFGICGRSFVGAIPGLSVSMATALLVSITYTWDHSDALAMIMGVYVVGVFSGAVSAILINIPGAPSSVVTTLDGYPMSKKGQSYKALFTATIYSFVGSVLDLLLWDCWLSRLRRLLLSLRKWIISCWLCLDW